jgi:hypothetical protein
MGRIFGMHRLAYAGVVDLSDEVMPVDDDDGDDETWHVLMGPGDVKVVSLDRLNDLYRWDLIDDRTYVWKPGMRAWQQLFLLMGPTDEEPKQEEQPFSVVVAPGEIKQLSLEQLDDWYRLDLIDARTLIWQPGMSGWQPLGVVAGIETRPATTAATSLAPSAPPVALTLPAPAQRSGGTERWLLRAALAVGLVMTLYRNDLMTEMARSVHQDAAFEHLGQRLGGPGFGTVGGVEALLESNRLPVPEVRVPELLVAQEIGHEPAAAAAASSVPPESSVAPTPSAAPAPANPTGTTTAEAAHPSGVDRFGAAAPPRSKRAQSSRTKSTRPATDDIVSRARKAKRGRGTEYDPLNPSL